MTDKATEPHATTRLGKKLMRHPIASVVIGSLIVGVIMWSSGNYWGILINDAVQDNEIVEIKEDVEKLTLHVKEEMTEVNETCDNIETEQMQQRIMLVEIKAAIENLD